MNHDIIRKYFPGISGRQEEQYRALWDLYADWNRKINVISRNDMEHLYERHVLYSLAIARVIRFREGTSLLDVGTGGGFPGIPLAIMFPGCRFVLNDSIGKKVRVVEAVRDALGLSNVTAVNARAEEIKERFDFILGRAVTSLQDFLKVTRGKILASQRNDLVNGVIYLKGGEIGPELEQTGLPWHAWDISDFFSEEFFETKKVVHIHIIPRR